MVSLAKNSRFDADRTLAFKRDQRAKFVLREGYLNEQTRRQLHRLIPQDNPVETTSVIEDGIRDGSMTLLHVYERGEKVGWTVYSIIKHDAGKEFLSVASHGKSRSDLSTSIIPHLERLAKDKGCQSIRLHTMRTGLVRKLESKLDWYVSEIVMRKDLG